jgi:acyl-CoA-binding protein
MWALYKQATEGDAKEQFKQGMSPREVDMNRSQQTKSNIEHDQQQYEAWSKYKGKPKQ